MSQEPPELGMNPTACPSFYCELHELTAIELDPNVPLEALIYYPTRTEISRSLSMSTSAMQPSEHLEALRVLTKLVNMSTPRLMAELDSDLLSERTKELINSILMAVR